MLCGNGHDVCPGNTSPTLLHVVQPEPVDEVLMEATVRNVRNLWVDGIKAKVCRRVGTCEQALCEVFVSLLPDCVMGMDTVSDMETSLLSSTIKQTAWKASP